jgi:hypothetical protein
VSGVKRQEGGGVFKFYLPENLGNKNPCEGEKRSKVCERPA